jgi:hypothetical protein
MPNFVWAVKDKFGKRAVKEIVAGTVEQSKAQLLADGHKDLELVESEISDAMKAGRPATIKVLGKEIKVTAEERLKHRNKPPKTYWSVLCEGVAHSKGLCLLIIIVAIYEGYSGNKISVILLAVGLLAWLAFLITNGLPSIYFRRLVKASDWNRWTEVLELVDKLKQINRFHFNKVTPFFLARSRAKALAGLDKLPEAINEFQQFENQPGCPSWRHKMLMAGVYDTAKQYDKSVEYTRKSIEENPTSVGYLDLANRFARYKRDTKKAREALAEAEKITMTNNEKAFHLRCRGILAYLETDYASAQKELKASLEIMEQTRNVPFRDGHISVAKAYLCCVLAKQDNFVAAKKCFEEAKEYLVATKETDLIDECKQLLGDSNL